jgi:hypothetical protein
MLSKLLIVKVLILFSAVVSLANNQYTVVKDALADRLEKDLAVEKIEVKLSNVKNYYVSKTIVGVKGRAMANRMPIEFDVKLNKSKLIPAVVEYNIVEPPLAADLTENKLTREILGKLNRDLKTSNIVLAIDHFDNEDKTKIVGKGEVRIGFEWKIIQFEVVEKKGKKTSAEVKYQIY